MTDNEIIKALECCYTTGTSCEECPMYNFDECNDVLMAKYVRDLINRQQAEFERLNNDLRVWKDIAHRETGYVGIAKAEAIKEFANGAINMCYEEFGTELEIAHTFAEIINKTLEIFEVKTDV